MRTVELLRNIVAVNLANLHKLSDWQIVDNYGKIMNYKGLAYHNEDIDDNVYFRIEEICKRYEREIDRRF